MATTTTTVALSEKEEIPTFLKDLSVEDKKALRASTASISSSAPTLTPSSAPFTPGKFLQINARGIRAIRLPFPSSELEIAITDAQEQVVYVSTRPQRSSGNCVLSSPADGELACTEYFFGPGRDPVVTLLQQSGDEKKVDAEGAPLGQQVRTTSKWTSRSHAFLLPDGREFEWAYVKELLPAALVPEGMPEKEAKKKITSLVLREKVGSGGERSGKRIAQLVRTDETRTLGSGKCSAGNGGALVLDVDADKFMSETLVVASCLLMLKKEIDRRRAVQFMMLGAAASGGP